MHSAPTIRDFSVKDSEPPENAIGVRVDGKNISPQAIQKDASRGLERETRQASKKLLGSVSGPIFQGCQGQCTEGGPHSGEQALHRSCLLAMQPGFSNSCGNLAY